MIVAAIVMVYRYYSCSLSNAYSPTVITTYHVSWFCLAAFLLLNLVTGAVINNYQIAIEEQERRKKEKRKARENSEYI